MKLRSLTLALVILSASSLALGAQAAKSSSSSGAGDWGLLFDAKNLLALDGFEDGYQAGAGVKYWINPSIAARALVMIDHVTPPEDSLLPVDTKLGLSLAGEWHPTKRSNASPYLGGLVGFRSWAVETVPETRIDIYLGGIFGVEVKLLQSIYCFAEYQLQGAFDADGFTLSLGTEGSDTSRALLGLIFYF